MARAERPRVLITGACEGVGRDCAEVLAARGAELILADNDAAALSDLSTKLGAVGRYCDVASEASVTVFAADILAHFPELDMVINAAGGGYERTLGMYRVSRTFMSALRKGTVHNILLNIPPADKDEGQAIFPYASSKQAFQRLCAALAAETRGSSVRVLIGCPHSEHVSEVLPDPNAGLSADTFGISMVRAKDDSGLAAHIAALLVPADMDVIPFDRRSVA
ncbi:MAG TPA: SDR family NAD(P)-dependent oxidoreductase [Sphingomicrobium sp.]|nr:SDR family NAD(P)-dependent oxidoreductase [Sphingomicrobium sp.]